MNKIFLCGRLTRNPETRQAGSTTVTSFGLAVQRRGKDEADFFNVVVFGKSGEAAEKYLAKGSKILLSGRVQVDSYTDHNGIKKNAWQVICDEWEFADSKKAEADQGADFVPIPEDAPEEGLPFS